jgi:hypothetical protein
MVVLGDEYRPFNCWIQPCRGALIEEPPVFHEEGILVQICNQPYSTYPTSSFPTQKEIPSELGFRLPPPLQPVKVLLFVRFELS